MRVGKELCGFGGGKELGFLVGLSKWCWPLGLADFLDCSGGWLASALASCRHSVRVEEITKNSRKEDVDIEKILKETRELQLESNSVQERLNRTHAVVDETVFREAQKDQVGRQAYRILTNIHGSFEQIAENLLATDRARREVTNYEGKLATMASRSVDIDKLKADLDTIRRENDLLEKKLSKDSSQSINMYEDKLEEVLAGASTEDKTVIIAIVNKAYVEGDKPMLDIFLDGFWLGEGTDDLIKHLLIVVMDQTSYRRCTFLHLHCYKLQTEGVDFVGEKLYMSKDFIKMMWRRTQFLGDVLKRGYSFIFTDTDVLWLRNPFSNLSHNKSIDLQISTDIFNGDQWSEANLINTGFYMIRSNNKTIALFDKWYSKKNNSTGLKEQDVLQNLIREGEFQNLGLKVRFLDTIYFSGFCQNSKDVGAVVTVHSNCCRRIRAKMADLLAVIHDWKRFIATTTNDTETSTFQWTPHYFCQDSWLN
ncbi:hypothetical protein HAX54_027010 [Datura stramonium]|uniref:Nucleotide-diphospho-sugar transferase domain-containing protein n=1 Tax=Datura stramonium TaxID=4076 RepID=A0ABS8S8H0_DATST|nr:hypothetical protein [Datura stramonium]